ncbi:unnamed protein product [Phytophthora fragariaefolia]|uniref:Unnamed protein product n=1 Tax=Phytophthora fragariaefolia TaxID=1490495 RepID=A0A9W7CVD5_9STRA|nr:unnamed protein product [Phytophthora fragariaefolia]
MTSKPASAHFQLLKLSTQIKLGELTKHERKLESHYRELLVKMGLNGDSAAASTDAEQSRKQLEDLYVGVKDLQVVQTNVHEGLEDIGGLVEFAAADPWSTQTIVEQRKQQILREVHQRRSLWQHNKLLGELLIESLEETGHSQEEGEQVRSQDGALESTNVMHAEADNEPLAKLSREETQQRLESYFFQSSGVSEEEVFEFLKTEVFQERDGLSKARTQRQQEALHQAQDVTCCVAALIRDKAFLNPDVVALFTDAMGNNEILKELSHVLTIELSNVTEWHWPEDGVHVNIQRGMNGRFRCLLQEEAITLLLFQYIGLKWCVEMKAVLRSLLDSLSNKPWLSGPASVESVRADMMRQFQLFALPDSMKGARRSPYDDDNSESGEDGNKKADKQDIIRRVLVEAYLQRTLVGEEKGSSPLVVVMTDLEFFGPSVSHEAVFACLRFLGVHDDMIEVFRRYMQIPLIFPGFEKPKVMRRGLPVSRMMTILLAEVELFVMDYLVLVSADIFLYRSHDDICFFDADEAKVLQAWSEMQRFAKCVGLRFNEDKSGSIRLNAGSSSTKAETGAAPLPASPIRWGLLELQSNGSVKIRHAQDALSTLRRVHKLVFPKTNGDAIGYLRKQVTSAQKGVAPAIPASWVYWPLNLGGLGSYNPFLAIWDVQESLYTYLENYHTRLDREWPKLKKDWVWQSPFSTVFLELKQQYDLFVEQAESEGFEWINKCSDSERFAYMKSSKISDRQREYGQNEPKLDDTFSLRSFGEYVHLLPSLMNTRLASEFRELLSEANEFSPPLPKLALQQEAEALFSSANVSGYLSECVAFIYSAQRRPARVPAKAPSLPAPAPQKRKDAAGSSSLWVSICSSYLPNALVVAVAAAAVWFEFTTGAVYVQSPGLQMLLKRSFIVWVCLAVRTQLTDFVMPPSLARRPPSLRKEGIRHARALFAAVAANLLGTTIIRPVFGAAPQFEETVRLVVPIYFLVEVVLDGLRVPMPLLKAVVGLSVSWLKAVTIPKLVLEWKTNTDGHPIGFLAISTANLYASGTVLRYLTNYSRTQRVLDLSLGAFGFILQIIGTSAVIGIVAHIANHFVSEEERIIEARVLYFCVAWFALDKYWKKALGDLLVQLLTTSNKSKSN